MTHDPSLDPSRPLRIVYMGTPLFAVPALRALLDSRHHVVGVFTNPDRPSGRGNKLTHPPVKLLAAEHHVEVYQPERVRNNPDALATLRAWKPHLVVVAAYGQILPQELLDIPPLGCLNIHASLLPAYRGAAPINWCIVRGETSSGVTIMRMEAGLDTGPMLLKQELPIPPLMTAATLHDQLCELGAPLLLRTIDGLLDGSITPEPQDHDAASWAPMIKKEDALVDWTLPAEQIANLIRGFSPAPGAYTFHHSAKAPVQPPARLKLLLAAPLDIEERGEPGEILRASAADDALVIACGQGAIACLQLQAPGKRAMSPRDLLNGSTIARGDRLASEAL